MNPIQVAKKNHQVELDGVRGLAISLVLIWHYVGCVVKPVQPDLNFFIWKATSLTWCGVDIFFVLSGFLIGGILIDNRSSPRLFRTFYARRIARIFPLYYVVVLSSFGALYWGIRSIPGSLPFFDGDLPLWVYLTHLQNLWMIASDSWGYTPLSLTWSLAVEEQFYLLLPIAIWWAGPAKTPHLLVLGVVSGWLFRNAAFHFYPHPTLATYMFLPCRWDSLCGGALLAWAIRNKSTLIESMKQRSVFIITIWSSVALMPVLVAMNLGIGTALAAYWGHTLFAIFSLALIAEVTINPNSRIAKWCRSWWLCWLGTISYSLYLVHSSVHHLVFWLFTGISQPQLNNVESIILTLLSAAISLGVAAASWHLFEKPILQRVRRSTHY